MCMLCVDEAVMMGSVIALGAPWYMQFWRRVWKLK